MKTIFKEKLHIEKDTTLKDIAKFFQEGANHQFKEYLLGEEAMWSKGLAWVIVRREFFINKLPKEGTDVVLTTWAGKGRHGLYPRWFDLKKEDTSESDKDENPYVTANCQWAIIDTEAREMLFSDDILKGTAPYCTKDEEGPKIKVLHRFPEVENEKIIVPEEEMIDKNNHVNNSYYLKWIEELYDEYQEAAGKSEKLSYVWIEYTKEILAGSSVRLRWTVDEAGIQIGDAEKKAIAMYIKGYTENECHFSAIIA